MIKKLARLIYHFVYWLEYTNGYISEYRYETAPYCGHSYNGHDGKFCYSDYREGDGQCFAHINIGKLWITASHDTEEGWELSAAWVHRVDWGFTKETEARFSKQKLEAMKRDRLFTSYMKRMVYGWSLYKWRIRKLDPEYTAWLPKWFVHDKPYMPKQLVLAPKDHYIGI